ncbi:unnamed protein product [Periconia digitata]|uniref:Uncharacterized protein n=1 Tax=Periconia digitata TaxID=1303443 RepID=A0A9W4U9F7_9PLEO|nr:unnamed protein product [Periconia digitata]
MDVLWCHVPIDGLMTIFGSNHRQGTSPKPSTNCGLQAHITASSLQQNPQYTMQSLRRTAVTAARSGRTTLPRQPRRFTHDEHAHGGHGHGPEPVNESMGNGFWITIGAVPVGWAIYAMSRSDDPNAAPLVTRLIDKYTEAQEKWTARNDLHVRMIEQAGSERVLFVNSTPQEYVPLKFPEIMTVSSPYNVPASSHVNLDKVLAKYRQEANEDNERKLEALRNGTIKSEQPFQRFPAPSTENRKWPN